MAALLPITLLDPDSTPPPDKTIRAVVSLYWPYSSSTQQCALLLTDPDPRLRSRRGQVRVRFTAASATAVAHGKVGIGDEVLLGLRGVRWASDGARVSTPGKSVEGELVFKGELSLRIVKKAGSSETIDQHLTVNVSTPPPDQQQDAHQTPPRSTRVASLRNSRGDVDLVPIYSSPAFVRRQRLSGDGFVKEAAYDPFADIDQELENEQPRKRQRISDVSSWRFAGRSPSPEKQRPVKSGSGQVDANVEQVRYQASKAEHMDIHESAEQSEESQLADDADDALKESQSLPVKLSPLPPPIPDFSSHARDVGPIEMLPPALPKLQLPDDTFTSESNESRNGSQLEPRRPATPKLTAVPGSALPLPSPFPHETEQPPQFPSPTSPDGSKAVAQEAASSARHGLEPELAPDDGVQLQVNPTITALAKQHRRVAGPGDTGSVRALEQALRDPASQHSDSSFDDSTNDTALGSLSQDPDRYNFRRHRPAASQTDVYPEPRESGSDTEEDEVMHKAYSQQIQSHARNALEREGIKTRDWVHKDDAAEVIHDMGDMPSSSTEHLDGEHDDNELSSIQGDEDDVQQTFIQEPEVMSALDSANLALHSNTQAEHDELMIDVRSRLLTASAQSATQSSAEDDREAAPSATCPDKLAASHQPITVDKNRAEARPKANNVAQTGKAAVSASAKEAPRVPPKTPAKTLQSLFGFNYGMDGTNDQPMQASGRTPQSQKERIMKKTYSSLFGFRASPSPEKQDAPLAQPIESSHQVGASQNIPLEQDRSIAVVADLTQSGSVVIDGNRSGGLGGVADNGATAGQSQAADQTPAGITEPQLSSQQDSSTTQPGSLTSIATHDVFGSLEVQLSELSDAGLDHTEDSFQMYAPLDSEQDATEPALQTRPRPVTTFPMVDVPLALDGRAETLSSFSAATMALPEPEPQESVQTDAPFDDEAFVASMLNDTTSPAASPDSPRDDAALGTRDEPVGSSPVASPSIPATTTFDQHRVAANGATVVRSLPSQKVPSPSRATPRASPIEVVELSSSNESSDEDEPDQPVITPAPSQLTQLGGIGAEQDVTTDRGDLDRRRYSPAEVVSPPAVADPRDVDMQDVGSNVNDALADVSSQGESHVPDVDVYMPDAQDENLLWARSPRAQDFAPSSLPQQDQASVAASTHAKDIIDGHRYFSLQSDRSDSSVSDEEDIDTVEQDELNSQPHLAIANASLSHIGDESHQRTSKSNAQSAILELSSSPPQAGTHSPARVSEVLVAASSLATQSRAVEPDDSSHVSASPTLQSHTATRSHSVVTNAEPALAAATSQGSRSLQGEQVEDSSVFGNSMHETRRSGAEQETHAELPSPENSQSQPQAFAGETQHRMESQPFETQIPVADRVLPALPPTPAVTNEGLEVAAEVGAVEHTPTSPALKRRHRRNVSSSEDVAPVRRSTRNTESQSQQGKESSVGTRRTRSQRTASPEPSQVTTVRQTRSRRTATPESVTASVDSSLLTPEPPKPLRRSPRKSHAHAESFADIVEEVEEDVASPEPAKQSARKSPQKSEMQTQPRPQKRRKEIEEAGLSPPPKRAAKLQSPQSDQQEENRTPVTKPAAVASRKSITSRLGQVPEVISSWFTPRRSSRQQPELDTTEVDETTNDKAAPLQKSASHGIMTSFAYYTPLSSLEEKLNPASQPGVDKTVDVLAVVSDATKAPERAKSGPRDYFTIFKIVDAFSHLTAKTSQSFTRVEVFRPWHATLPVAQAGDVVLLRGFAVKSRNRQPYLLSTDASAWLVWKFGEAEAGRRPGSSASAAAVGGSPRRTRRGSLAGTGVREETKGPPVELGDQERQRAKELRAWWMGLSLEERSGGAA